MSELTERPVLMGTAAAITATDGALYGEGALAYATDTNQAYRYSGSAWTADTSLADHVADTSSAHVVAGLANGFAAIGQFASGDVNKAHGNAVTVTGIAVGDQLICIFKDSTPNLSHVALSDAVIGAGTITFTATDFGANDGILVLWLDLT